MAYAKTYWYLKASSWSAVSAWAATTTYVAGQWTRQTAPSVGSERMFVCIVAGTSGSSEPLWTITRGAKSTDGAVTWQECTGVAGPCGDVTNTPNWNIVKNTAVSLGQVIKDIAATTYFICTNPGTAGNGAEPTWNTTAGQTTSDGSTGLVWTSIGAISGYSTPFQYPHARMQIPAASGFMLAGEACYESNNHSETQATAMTIAATNGTAAKPLLFICVNDSVAPPSAVATTGSVATTGASAMALGSGAAYFYGNNFICGSGATQGPITLANSGTSIIVYDHCTFIQGASGAGNYTMAQNSIGALLLDCSMQFGNTGSSIIAGGTTFNNAAFTFQMIGGSIAASGSAPTTLLQGSGNVWVGTFSFRDVDMSNLGASSAIVNMASFSAGPIVYVTNCKTGASITPSGGSFTSPYLGAFYMRSCDNTASPIRENYRTYGGTVISSTSIYNNAGSSNGVSNFSNQIVTSANTTFTTPFVTEVYDAQWNDTAGGAIIITAEITSGTVLTNADVWLGIEYLGSSSSPLGSNFSSRAAWFAAPVTLTASSATWTGALANVYKIVGSVTPQLRGPILARLYVARPSTTLNYDVMVKVS